MTVDIYDDLGERLDQLADAFVGEVVLAHPVDADYLRTGVQMSRSTRWVRRTVFVSVVAIVVGALVLVAEQPDSTVTAPASSPAVVAPGAVSTTTSSSTLPPATTLAPQVATAGPPVFALIPAGIVPQMTQDDIDSTGQSRIRAIGAGKGGDLLVLRGRSLTVVDKSGQLLVISPELTDAGEILSAQADDSGYGLLIKTGDHTAEIRATVTGKVWDVVAGLATSEAHIIAQGWLTRDALSDSYLASLKFQSGTNFSVGSLYSVNAGDGTTVSLTVPSDGDRNIVGPIYRVGTSLVIIGQRPASVETVEFYRSSDNGMTWTFEQKEGGVSLQSGAGLGASTIDKEFLAAGHGGEGDEIKYFHPAIANLATDPNTVVTQASVLAPGYTVDDSSGPAVVSGIVDLGEGSYGVLLGSGGCLDNQGSCWQRRDVLVWHPTGATTGDWQYVTTSITS